MDNLKVRKIDDLSKYKETKGQTNKEILVQPLFHGTTRFVLECDKGFLSKFFDCCKEVITKAKNYYNHSPNKEDLNKKIQDYTKENNIPPFFCLIFSLGEASNFQYGDFYLTTNYLAAIDYASNKCGELGRFAYQTAMMFKVLNIDINTKEAMEFVLDNYHYFDESERVILIIKDISFDDLLSESGDELDPYWKEDIYETEVSEEYIRSFSFRLKNLNKYTFDIIDESLFKEGIECFTDIKDASAFLKKRYSFNYGLTNAQHYNIK